jgi:hypothetical protein
MQKISLNNNKRKYKKKDKGENLHLVEILREIQTIKRLKQNYYKLKLNIPNPMLQVQWA